jgi:choline dehydrogenase-like flavoprotein
VLSDANTVPRGQRLQADICIVGAGAAGITLAHELDRHHGRVVILESGGLLPHHETQRLYEGASVADPYYPLDTCRFRRLGGSTSHWGGWCRPLDAIDFEKRAWVADSGWPFPSDELTEHYAQAQRICGLARFNYDAAHWVSPAAPSILKPDGPRFAETIFQIRATRFGETHRGLLQHSENVHLLVNANATEVEMDPQNERATGIRVATLSGNRFDVAANWFVVAMGGIETPRLLLSSRGRRSCGVGNEQDLVGRFFSDHLHVPLGLIRPAHTVTSRAYQVQPRAGIGIRRAITLTDSYARSTRRLGFAVTLHNASDPHDVLSLAQTSPGYRALRHMFGAVQAGRWPERGLHHARTVAEHFPGAARGLYRRFVKPPAHILMVGARAEQCPNRESRVTLDTSRDDLGMPRARVAWRVSAQDIDNVKACRELLVTEFARSGVDLTGWSKDEHGCHDVVAGGAHHCGTTRMHASPTRGVVDEHCRIHGLANIFVAGSSVFPTIGWAPPTLTIVALAVRLAKRLKALTRQSL